MLQRVLRVVLVAACLLSLPSAVYAAPVLIDFESLTDTMVLNDEDLDPLTDEIPGLTFFNAVALASGASGGLLNEDQFPPFDDGENLNFNVVGGAGEMSIVFETPISSFSGLFTYIGIEPLKIELFDGSELVGTVTSLVSDNNALDGVGTPNELLSGTFLPGFSSVTISGGLFTLDNLEFNTIDQVAPIPEPSTLVLLGSGLALLVRQRRGAAHRRRRGDAGD